MTINTVFFYYLLGPWGFSIRWPAVMLRSLVIHDGSGFTERAKHSGLFYQVPDETWVERTDRFENEKQHCSDKKIFSSLWVGLPYSHWCRVISFNITYFLCTGYKFQLWSDCKFLLKFAVNIFLPHTLRGWNMTCWFFKGYYKLCLFKEGGD